MERLLTEMLEVRILPGEPLSFHSGAYEVEFAPVSSRKSLCRAIAFFYCVRVGQDDRSDGHTFDLWPNVCGIDATDVRVAHRPIFCKAERVYLI
jgi:hypothetical protein